MGLDTRGNGSNPTTRLQLAIVAAVAQFEREIMLERQREGIAGRRQVSGAEAHSTQSSGDDPSHDGCWQHPGAT
jgi:DNA invertase Pin-like site-specific DNA recombinase